MTKKIGPIIFVAGLLVILIFIIGVRYGEKVEKINKKVDFYLSIAPTKPAPTSPSLEFKTYQHEGCGISFLYPSFFKVEKESSNEATIKNSKKFVSFNCHQKAATEPTVDPQYSSFEKINPKNGKKIVFTVEKSLLPLLEKTLEFSAP